MDFPTVEDFKKEKDSTKQSIVPWSEVAREEVLQVDSIRPPSMRYGQQEVGSVYSLSKGAFLVWIPDGVTKQIMSSQAKTPFFLLNEGRIPSNNDPWKFYYRIAIV